MNIESKGKTGIWLRNLAGGELTISVNTSVTATGTKNGIYCYGTIDIQDANLVDATGPKGAIVSYREEVQTGDGIKTSGMKTEIGGHIESLNPDKFDRYTSFTTTQLTYECGLKGASDRVRLTKLTSTDKDYVNGLTLTATEMTTAETLNLNEKVEYSPEKVWADYKKVDWSIAEPNETGAKITDGWLSATKTGTIKLNAHVANGTGADYDTTFTITVTDKADFSVATENGKCDFNPVEGICYIMAAGDYEISNRSHIAVTDQRIYVNVGIIAPVNITLNGVNITANKKGEAESLNAISSGSNGITLILKKGSTNSFISGKDSAGIDIADLVI
ncbi:MAG: hypothetical protein RR347_07930, partial [Anaerovoracaceae bacterium]